ncbi:hypothetical protein GCM10028824_30080 [Hymenobacter segetis]|uniref:histidine kinase n=1 Tax=Hymenobacter segetis TaxID=2025509 RepID=A0ABU9LV94_9BACT
MLPPVELFQHLLEGSPLTTFVYSVTARRLLYVSAAYEQLFPGARCADTDADLPRLLSYLPPDDQVYALHCLGQLAAGELCDDLLLRVQPHPEVPLRWLSVQAWPAVGSDGQRLLCGTVQDVTLEQEYLRNADKYMAKKNTTLEILSHDLAGPFTMLQQLATVLDERTQALDDPLVRKLLRVMEATCRDSVNLIRDFVDGEFMDSANVDYKAIRVDLVQNIRQVVDTYQQGEHLVAKHFAFQTSQPTMYVEIDNNKFLQVINNLMSNAIKFTGEGGHIAVGLTQHPDHVLVTVADDGIGIPAHLLPVLFDRFTPARRPGLRGEKTTGLGMHIIETIVRLHHGRIWVESEENVGTTFYIKLPATVVAG